MPVQAEVDVYRRGGMRDRARRDEIGAALGVRARSMGRDAAGQLHCRPSINGANPLRGFLRHEVVEEDVLCSMSQGLIELLPRAHFDLDGHSAVLRSLHRLGNAAGRGYVIVLDQNGVEQAHAMILRAAGLGRHFLQPPQPRCRFARIEHATFRAFHGVGELGRDGRDAAQPLQKVQRDTLALQQRASEAVDARDLKVLLDSGAAAVQDDQFIDSAALAIDRLQQLHPGQHHRLTRDEGAGGALLLADHQIRRDVAGPDILGQRAAHRVDYFRMRNIETHARASCASFFFCSSAVYSERFSRMDSMTRAGAPFMNFSLLSWASVRAIRPASCAISFSSLPRSADLSTSGSSITRSNSVLERTAPLRCGADCSLTCNDTLPSRSMMACSVSATASASGRQ